MTTLPASCETCLQIKKQQLEPDMDQWTGSKLQKEYVKAVYYHNAYLTSVQSTSCTMLRYQNHKNQDCWEKYQQPQICRWHHSYGRKWRGTKEPLGEGERGEWISWLKTQHSKNEDHSIRSHHFMENRWETMETMTDVIFLGSKITADGDCSHEIKRCLLLGRRAVTKLDSVLKSRDITFPTKICIVKAMVFPVVMYGCERRTIKKTEG